MMNESIMNDEKMLLKIKNLSVDYFRKGKIIPAVRNVSLNLDRGSTWGIAGESGCGKTTFALSILKLISSHEGKIKGSVLFKNKEILTMPDEELRSIRGNEIGIVFQDPFSSLNPVIKIGDQIDEAILIHHPEISKKEARSKTLALLSHVRIHDAERIYHSYPHQLSGGQRQRVMIAMAISNRPKLLIADEPTTALDVTIQKEILELLISLQKELGMAIILVTHHFGIISETTDQLAVFYGGEIVEEGKTKEVIQNPQHPYTQSLLKALPQRKSQYKKKERLFVIPGSPPDPTKLPSGCIFHPRCPFVIDRCKTEVPLLREIPENRKASCHLSPFTK